MIRGVEREASFRLAQILRPRGALVLALGPAFAAILLSAGAPAPAAGGERPDGRVYEQVSPVDKHGNEAGLSTPGTGPSNEGEGEVPYAYATADGSGLVYGGSGPFGAVSNGLDEFSVAQRLTGGWSTTAAIPSGYGATFGNIMEEGVSGLLPSVDATRLLFTSPGSFVAADPNFEGSAAGEAAGVWLHGLDGSIEWLSQPSSSITPNPRPGHLGAAGNAMVLAGGSPKLDTAYFAYFGTLLPQDAARSPHVLPGSAGGPWGFYEWKDGTLAPAGVLPNGSLDPYGALPAGGIGHDEIESSPDDFANQVSADGKRAFFVSPDPRSVLTPEEEGIEDPPELYVRVDGQRTVLISRDTLAGGGPAPGPRGNSIVGVENPGACSEVQRCPAYVYASPDGSRAFFESAGKLANSSSGQEPTGVGPWAYEFNVDTEVLRYLPGVTDGAGGTSAVLASSNDGSRFIFEKKNSAGAAIELDMNLAQGITKISPLPAPPTTFLPHSADNKGFLYVAPARASADGSGFVFESDSPLPGFNNAPGYSEVYRYDVRSATLNCVSCPPVGTAPSGDARLSNDDHLPLGAPRDSREIVPPRGSRGISADGSRIFFDTPERLVEGDVNGQRDVYEWENGNTYLISPGRSPRPSVFLDSSESGNDVFFATAEGLVASDVDGSYDVYDARVGGGFPEAHPPAPCTSDCQAPSTPPAFSTPASATLSGEGNFAPASSHPASQPKRHKRAKPKHAKHKRKRHKAAHSRHPRAGARRR
jgi:hypothetical protein